MRSKNSHLWNWKNQNLMETNMKREIDESFVEVLKEATRKAFTDLFRNHPDEHFYYCTLVLMNGQGCPVVAAMSEEVLEKLVQEDVKNMDIQQWIQGNFSNGLLQIPHIVYMGNNIFQKWKK